MRNPSRIALALLAVTVCGSGACSAPDEEDGAYGASALNGSGPNLVSNPSFESETAGWGGWQSTVARVRSPGAPDGSYVAKVTRTTGSSFSIDDYPDTIPTVPSGARYTASVYVRAATSSSVGKPVSLTLRERASGNDVRSWKSPPRTLTNTWQQLTVDVADPTAANSLDLFVYQDSAQRNDAFYVDSFVLQRLGAAPVPDAGSPPSPGTDAGSPPSPGTDAGAPPPSPPTTALANRPTQPAALVYGSVNSTVASYAHPGALIAVGRDNYQDQAFKNVSAAGGTVIIYLDAIIDNPYGRYHEKLMKASECGAAVPRWPGGPQANEWGYLNDFRPGGVLQQKLECVLELMVTENPHMGGWFADDVGSRSWFPNINWNAWSTADKQAYRDGAIDVCKTFRKVADRHGLIVIVNGTWNGGDGGGYPDASQHGNALADGGFIENHGTSELPYWTGYARSKQWAAQSPVTKGVSFMWSVNKTAAERDAFAKADIVAFATAQPDYGTAEQPWTSFHPNGLPSHVK